MQTVLHGSVKSRIDNLEIATMTVIPKGEIRGIVQLVHGMSEHKERYLPFMEYLAERGFACFLHGIVMIIFIAIEIVVV